MRTSTRGARFIARERGIIGSPERKTDKEKARELFSSKFSGQVSEPAVEERSFGKSNMCAVIGKNTGIADIRREGPIGHVYRRGNLLLTSENK